MCRLIVALVLLSLSGFAPEARALQDGDVVVADVGSRSILQVDPSTGDRTEISSDTIGTGPLFAVPRSIAALSASELLVLDGGLDAVIRVDPATGNRTVVSSPTVGAGIVFSDPTDLASDLDGNILVTDAGFRVLWRVDPTTGDRTVLSSSEIFAPVGTGPDIVQLSNVAVGSSHLWVTDSSLVAVLRIDRTTGDRVLISGNGAGTGPPFGVIRDISVAPDGRLLVRGDGLFIVDPNTGERQLPELSGLPATGVNQFVFRSPNSVVATDGPRGAVMELAYPTGMRTLVSTAQSQYAQEIGSGDLAISSSGDVYTLKFGAITRFDPATGVFTYVTCGGNGPGSCAGNGSGPDLTSAKGLGVDLDGSLLVAAGDSVFRVDAITGDRTLLSGPTVGAGPSFTTHSIVGHPTGDQIVLENSLANPLLVYRVDSVTGDRSLVANFGGFSFIEADITLLDSDHVMLLWSVTGASGLFEVNLNSGVMNPIFTAIPLVASQSLLRESADTWLIRRQGAIRRVDVAAQTVDSLSQTDPNDAFGSGPAITTDPGLVLEANGDIIVHGENALLRVDPVTGDRTEIPLAPLPGSGPGFSSPQGIAVVGGITIPSAVPALSAWALAVFGLLLLVCAAGYARQWAVTAAASSSPRL